MKTEPTLPLNEILLRISKIEEKQNLQDQAIQELRANSVPKSKIVKNKGTKRINVSVQVTDLFIKYPGKVWTSGELAKKICCSAAAVRKTSAWNWYQEQREKNRQQCSIHKGFKDKSGNIITTIEDNEIDD